MCVFLMHQLYNQDLLSLYAVFQKAVKEKKLNLWELEKDVLGTEKEQKVPPGSNK